MDKPKGDLVDSDYNYYGEKKTPANSMSVSVKVTADDAKSYDAIITMPKKKEEPAKQVGNLEVVSCLEK